MTCEDKIRELARSYQLKLDEKVSKRVQEMAGDSDEHRMIYRILGVSDAEGNAIDIYQNKGRFLYKYAGSFLEEAAILCFQEGCRRTVKKVKVDNLVGNKPKKFEIDCLVDDHYAYEIKWRDATTDGDHINKEYDRLESIVKCEYMPIRLMFFKPNRKAAIQLQRKLEIAYHKHHGLYYAGKAAWNHVKEVTGIDLLSILERISNEAERNELS